MAREFQVDAKRTQLTWVIAGSGLCVMFYMLGAWQNSAITVTTHNVIDQASCDFGSPSIDSSKSNTIEDPLSSVHLYFDTHHAIELNTPNDTVKFLSCDMSYSEYTLSQDKARGRKFDRNMLKYRERHCPAKDELLRCLIPAPPNYKTPFKWPQSRDYASFANIPHKELSIEKAGQNWVQVEGERLRFPGGGTMFPLGADAYIDDISELIPMNNGEIRTAVDTGCGVIRLGSLLAEKRYRHT